MSKNHSQRNFIASDIASIAKATTITEGTDFDSQVIDVTDVDVIVLQGKVTGGNASASGNVTFTILGTLDDSLWDTVAVATLVIAMSGASQIVQSDPLDVRGYRSLKLGSIQNADASYTATVVNLKCGKSYGHIQ